jgi:glycosyltransferase involved in cell wall biosynthesis
MSKIKVLVVPSDRTGVGKFRSVDPHIFLQNQYPNDFHVDIDYDPNMEDLNYWSNYQIVHFHRTITPDYDKSRDFVEMLNMLGIVTIMDLDDYWLPTKEHPIHPIIIQHKIHEKIIANVKAAKYVSTTTTLFADEISKMNKNVVVFPNAINPKEPQFCEPTIESNKLRVGWLGGSSHLHDIMLLEGLGHHMESHKNDAQFYLCGFDIRGAVTEINKDTGEQTKRPIKPHETVWARYEEIITNNYKLVDSSYQTDLMKWKEFEDTSTWSDSYYQRVWTRPVTSYAKNYSKFDVSLAPIKNHMFNRMKSQLKVIEAGFYKKALIASNVGPYTIDLKHCLDNGNFVDGNAMLVNENRNHSDWYKFVKKLVKNPNMAKDMGERLYETVKDVYDLTNVTKARAEFYKSIV